MQISTSDLYSDDIEFKFQLGYGLSDVAICWAY